MSYTLTSTYHHDRQGNVPVSGEFPLQTATNAERIPYHDVIMNNTWWRHQNNWLYKRERLMVCWQSINDIYGTMLVYRHSGKFYNVYDVIIYLPKRSSVTWGRRPIAHPMNPDAYPNNQNWFVTKRSPRFLKCIYFFVYMATEINLFITQKWRIAPYHM